MTFDEYSTQTDKTRQYNGTPQERLSYVSIALGGEVGEYLNEYKKHLRTAKGLDDNPRATARAYMLLELGDTLWYLSQVADELGSSLDEVAQLNVEKLMLRYSRKAE